MRYQPDPDKTAVRQVPDDFLRTLKDTTVYDASELLARAGLNVAEPEAADGESLEIPIDLAEDEPPRSLPCIPPPSPLGRVSSRWHESRRLRGSTVLLLATEVLLTAGVIYFFRWLASAF